MKKSIRLFLILFIGLNSFVGCQKENPDNYNPYTINESPTVEEAEIDPNIALQEAVVQHTNFLMKLLAQASMIIYAEKTLYGLVDNQAVVRDCPDHTQTGTFAGATPDPSVALEITFDDCTPLATFGHTYDGTIGMLFNGPLGADQTLSPGATDDFTMKIAGAGLTVNNGSTTFTITSPSDIEFDYASISAGNFIYNYELGGNVTVTDGRNITTYPTGMKGQFELVDINNDDDNNNPFTFIENEFKIGIDVTTVHCDNGVTSGNICLETTLPISIEALTCGCPKSGLLELEMTCGGSVDVFDFGADAFGMISNECDRNVLKNMNERLILPSCDNCNTSTSGCETVFLKPDSQKGKDAVIILNNNHLDSNQGDNTALLMLGWTNFSGGSPENDRRSLIEFTELKDIQSLDLVEATLKLYEYPNYMSSSGGQYGNNTTNIFRITEPWEESTVTWENQPNYDNSVSSTIPQNNNYTLIEVDVTDLVNEMISSPSTSYGFMMRLADESRYRAMTFTSSDYSDYELAPELIIYANNVIYH